MVAALLRDVLILDGGLGSEVDRRVRASKSESGHWCALYHVAHADVVERIHAEYVRAGAQLLTANTYACLQYLLHEPDDEMEALARKAVQLARSAAGARPVLIAGSVSAHGSVGLARSQLAHSFDLLCTTLKESQVDCIMLEMMQDAQIALQVVQAASRTGLPLFLGFSVIRVDGSLVLKQDRAPFDSSRVDGILQAGRNIVCVGIMHSDISDIEDGLRVIAEVWSGKTMAYPDHGAFEAGTWLEHASGAEEDRIVDHLESIRTRVPSLCVVGGCCGLGPGFIARVARRIGRA